MNNYLVQVAYTPQAWTQLIAHPHNRMDDIRPIVEKLGGKIVHSWFAFGDYDIIAVVEMPGNVEAAGFALAAAAGGACKTIKTTPMLTTAEGIEAMKKAATSGYKVPGSAAHA